MPYQTLRLTNGANVVETPALNEAGVSSSQLVRFKPDPKGMVLVEKLGGWAKFFSIQVTTVVRAIWGWQDNVSNKWFAFATSSSTRSSLTAVGCTTDINGVTTATGTRYPLAPQYINNLSSASFLTVAGSSTVTVIDPLMGNPFVYGSVLISTPISVGGLVLSGSYSISSSSLTPDRYTITARNALGQPAAAVYSTVAAAITVTGGTYTAGTPNTLTLTFSVLASAPFPVGENVNVTGVLPVAWNGSCIVISCTTTQVVLIAPAGASGTWTSGGKLSNYGVTPILSALTTNVINVVFPGHGQAAGSTFTILNPISVGLSTPATLYGDYIVSSVTNAYSFVFQLPSSYSVTTNSVFQGGNIVTGGTSTISAVTLTVGNASFPPVSITVTGGTSTTTVVHLTFTAFLQWPHLFNVGQTIYVSGVSPGAWNGTFTVTNSSYNFVEYSLSGSALSWVSGGTVKATPFNIGADVVVTNVNPSAWNGTYAVTGATDTTITYALSGAATSWVSGGNISDVGGDATLTYVMREPNSIDTIYGKNVAAQNWALDNWGEALIFSPVDFSPISNSGYTFTYSPIFVWDPVLNLGNNGAVIATGPVAITGVFVAMPQRQLVAWGTTFTGIIDPLLIRWCDVSNYNVWIGQITNQAGSYRLTSGSAIKGALQSSQQALIWTDIGLWSMQYIGPPYVYSFNELSRGCGLIARRASGIMNSIVYWMGLSQFFMYSGDGVQPIACPIWDVVFQNLDKANLSKIIIAVNSLFQEVTWYYPVFGDGGDCSAYVRYNALTQMWDYGTLGRTAWMDTSLLGPPIGYDPTNQYIYQHEISPDADGQAMVPSFTTGYFAIAEGDDKAFIDQVRPDMKWGYYNQTQNASVQITFNALDYAGGTPTTYGPFTVTQSTTFFSPRIRARLVSVTVSSSDTGTWWRLGALRYRVAPDGKF